MLTRAAPALTRKDGGALIPPPLIARVGAHLTEHVEIVTRLPDDEAVDATRFELAS
jgi:hypothetical protein